MAGVIRRCASLARDIFSDYVLPVVRPLAVGAAVYTAVAVGTAAYAGEREAPPQVSAVQAASVEASGGSDKPEKGILSQLFFQDTVTDSPDAHPYDIRVGGGVASGDSQGGWGRVKLESGSLSLDLFNQDESYTVTHPDGRENFYRRDTSGEMGLTLSDSFSLSANFAEGFEKAGGFSAGTWVDPTDDKLVTDYAERTRQGDRNRFVAAESKWEVGDHQFGLAGMHSRRRCESTTDNHTDIFYDGSLVGDVDIGVDVESTATESGFQGRYSFPVLKLGEDHLRIGTLAGWRGAEVTTETAQNVDGSTSYGRDTDYIRVYELGLEGNSSRFHVDARFVEGNEAAGLRTKDKLNGNALLWVYDSGSRGLWVQGGRNDGNGYGGIGWGSTGSEYPLMNIRNSRDLFHTDAQKDLLEKDAVLGGVTRGPWVYVGGERRNGNDRGVLAGGLPITETFSISGRGSIGGDGWDVLMGPQINLGKGARLQLEGGGENHYGAGEARGGWSAALTFSVGGN